MPETGAIVVGKGEYRYVIYMLHQKEANFFFFFFFFFETRFMFAEFRTNN